MPFSIARKFGGRIKWQQDPETCLVLSSPPVKAERSPWESYSIPSLGPVISRPPLLLWGQKPAPGHRQLVTDLLSKGHHLRAMV